MVPKFVYDDANAAVLHFAEFLDRFHFMGTAPPEMDRPTRKRNSVHD